MEELELIKDLVSRARDGDKHAYTNLIKHIDKELYNIARVKLDNNEDDVNDAIQETMLHSFKNIKELKNAEYFKTWIVRILINECNKIYKSKHRQFNLFDKITKFGKAPEYDTSSVDKTENKILVDDLLKILNKEEHMCITMFYGNNYSVNKIAEILNTSPNTVKSRIARGKEKMKNHYTGGVENEPTFR